MSDLFSKRLSEMLGKMDDKVLKTKLNSAIDMLKNGKTEDLAKKINKSDKDELISKINEFAPSKLNELDIDPTEIKKKINDSDLEKLSQLIGQNGDELVSKIKDILGIK